ncbi:hypothetical protein [Desulfosporosinus sp. BG]|uniref:hypothetical protein n=1 Tax=Desulfosporosinus sp. BG TaxID=1633135 RepID=UPI00083AED31|nr:hypothetical protein [Desulfosporosinus sp. BG]ODA40819.1 hypothetical protein DSBG_2395 [Desulfosporosinus sp. BG]
MASSKAKLLIILSVALSLVCGCNKENKVSAVHDFSIYLVKDLSTTEAMNKNLDELPLENVPALTDKEIRMYNWREHTFSLKEGFSLEEKLEGRVPLSGKPFVVVADSERIYLGSFWTPISSLYIPEIPTIYSIWFKDNKNDIYTIKYGNQQQDPRADIRIYESLKGLGKVILKER